MLCCRVDLEVEIQMNNFALLKGASCSSGEEIQTNVNEVLIGEIFIGSITG